VPDLRLNVVVDKLRVIMASLKDKLSRNQQTADGSIKSLYKSLYKRLDRLAARKWARGYPLPTDNETCGQCKGLGHYCHATCEACEHQGFIEGIGNREMVCEACHGQRCTCDHKDWTCIRCFGSGKHPWCGYCQNTGYSDYPSCDEFCAACVNGKDNERRSPT
jgi:hypothetical protein